MNEKTKELLNDIKNWVNSPLDEIDKKYGIWELSYEQCKSILNYIEAYENMRKEAIEYVKWQRENPQYDNVWRNSECESLLNILNKVGEDNENN